MIVEILRRPLGRQQREQKIVRRDQPDRGPISPKRCATRWWWLSTGRARIRRAEKASTPRWSAGRSPGNCSSHARASAGGMSARKSRVSRAGAGVDGQEDRADQRRLPGATARRRWRSRSPRDRPASRHPTSEAQAQGLEGPAEAASFLRCESSAATSSDSGSSQAAARTGRPTSATRRACTFARDPDPQAVRRLRWAGRSDGA